MDADLFGSDGDAEENSYRYSTSASPLNYPLGHNGNTAGRTGDAALEAFHVRDERGGGAGAASSSDHCGDSKGMTAWFAEVYGRQSNAASPESALNPAAADDNGAEVRNARAQQYYSSNSIGLPLAQLTYNGRDHAGLLNRPDLVQAVEAVGDAEFARARAPMFEKAKEPHQFSREERARMDKYESIDYGEPQSFLHKSSVAEAMWRSVTGRKSHRGWLKWVMFVAIGVAVGLWSVLLFQTLDYLADVKLTSVQDFIRAQQRAYERHHRKQNGNVSAAALSASSTETSSAWWLRITSSLAGDSTNTTATGDLVSLPAILHGYGVFALWSVVAAMLSSLCCVVMPSAAGSGIPDVMAYLNGIMFPRIFNVRNLITKTLSCILAVSAGLPVGTEGPIIHIGSLIGAGLPTGRSRSLRCSATSVFHGFRNAKDERDFISAGAACGLTSAFSSPLGGMLFVLEEVATFFPVRLAWLVLVSCLSCMCVTQYVNTHLSGWRLVHGEAQDSQSALWGNFRDGAIAMFYLGTVPDNRVPMNLLTFGPTVVVAVVAGALAVMYTVNSVRLSRWRARRLFPKPVLRVLEPGVFALLFATACYFAPLLLCGCRDAPPGFVANMEQLHVELVTAFCQTPPAESSESGATAVASPRRLRYHPLATLAMTSPYNLLRLLFSRQTQGLIPATALLVHLLLYTAGSSYAGGMFLSCGTVIPSLLIGAMTGRLVGELLGQHTWADPGVLALIGAAGYFSGISRLTFSLIVIFMELTADLTHVTCLMLAVIVAKGIADKYCHSLYTSTLEVKAAPLLELQTDIHMYDTFCARDIATSPVVTLSLTETVVHVLEVLHATTHNAFPVVSPANGTYAGVITRTQLQHLLWVMYFREEDEADHEEEEAYHGNNNSSPAGDSGTPQQLSVPSSALPPAAAASAPSAPREQQQQRRENWLGSQRHAAAEELASVRETLFWERLPAMPPPGCLPMDLAQCYLDLSPYVDLTPFYVLETVCVSRTYYLFRHLGLRHLPVLDRHMRVTGMLTRTSFVGDRLQEKVARAAGQGSARTAAPGLFEFY